VFDDEPSFDMPLQPQAVPQVQPSALRASLLKKPLDAVSMSPAPAASASRFK
jgi:hypothetical protein